VNYASKYGIYVVLWQPYFDANYPHYTQNSSFQSTVTLAYMAIITKPIVIALTTLLSRYGDGK